MSHHPPLPPPTIPTAQDPRRTTAGDSMDLRRTTAGDSMDPRRTAQSSSPPQIWAWRAQMWARRSWIRGHHAFPLCFWKISKFIPGDAFLVVLVLGWKSWSTCVFDLEKSLFVLLYPRKFDLKKSVHVRSERSLFMFFDENHAAPHPPDLDPPNLFPFSSFPFFSKDHNKNLKIQNFSPNIPDRLYRRSSRRPRKLRPCPI